MIPFIISLIISLGFFSNMQAHVWVARSAVADGASVDVSTIDLQHSRNALCCVMASSLSQSDQSQQAAQSVLHDMVTGINRSQLLVLQNKNEKHACSLLKNAFAYAMQQQAERDVLRDTNVAGIAVVCDDDALYVGHVGNSRAVLARGDSAYLLSHDHRAGSPSEYARLVDYGFIPSHIVTRSFGAKTHQKLQSTPSVTVTPLTHHDTFLIIGDAAFWRGISNNDAVAYMSEMLHSGVVCDDAIARLVAHASEHNEKNEPCSAVIMQRVPTRSSMVAVKSPTFSEQLDTLLALPAADWLNATIALPPLIGVLLKAYEGLNLSTVVPVAKNKTQESFIDLFFPYGALCSTLHEHFSLGAFSSDELQSFISDNAHDINVELKRAGFSIRLEQIPQLALYAATILKVMVQWREKGIKTEMRVGDMLYDAVHMHKGFLTYHAPGHDHPIFILMTKNNDLVFMTKAKEHCTNFALLNKALTLQESVRPDTISYDQLIFPMIDLSEKNDISWLMGLTLAEAASGYPEVNQIIQETIFKMNEEGALAKSAVATVIAFKSPSFKIPLVYTMDAPFLCWISRPGMKYPLFASYLDCEHWKNPGALFDSVDGVARRSMQQV